MGGLKEFFKTFFYKRKQRKLDIQLRLENWELANLDRIKLKRLKELAKKYPAAQAAYVHKSETIKDRIAVEQAQKHLVGYKNPHEIKIYAKKVGKGIQSFFTFLGETFDEIGKMGHKMSHNFEYGMADNGNTRRK